MTKLPSSLQILGENRPGRTAIDAKNNAILLFCVGLSLKKPNDQSKEQKFSADSQKK